MDNNNKYINTSELNKMKQILLSNFNLFDKAMTYEIYKYIINYPYTIQNYIYPLENEIENIRKTYFLQKNTIYIF